MRRLKIVCILCLILAALIAGIVFKDARAFASNYLPSGGAAATGSQVSGSLCDRNEQVVFSCAMKRSTKILSICTSKQVDNQNGYVQYRFGLPGKVELEFPAERISSQTSFSYSRYTRPLVTFLALRFESNGYKYSLHQDSNGEEKPLVNSSYLNITPPGENAKEIEMTCRQPVKGSLMLLEDVVPVNDQMDVLAP